MFNRGALIVLAVMTASPALGRGGWQVCIYGPMGSAGVVNFQSKHCKIDSDGDTRCDDDWQSQSIDVQDGYTNSKSLRDYWEDEVVDRSAALASSSGYYLIRFDHSYRSGFQEKVLKTRTLPFRILVSTPNSACNRYDTTYQFIVEGNGVGFYNGCPQSNSDCADKWR